MAPASPPTSCMTLTYIGKNTRVVVRTNQMTGKYTCIFLSSDWFSQLHVYLGEEKYTCENTRVFFKRKNNEINPRG